MSTTTGTASDPASLLRRMEQQWRPQLEQVSLVAELELTRQEIHTALRCLGVLWRRAPYEHLARPRFRRTYPACFLVGVSGMASIHYRGNALWPAVFEAAGLGPANGNDSSAWGRTFTDCLEELHLPTFPALDDDKARRYVSRILIHGGIPLDHVDEMFEVIERGRIEVGDGRRRDIHAWLVANRRRLYGIPTSLKRFLTFGDEYAVDTIDRFLDLLDHVRGGDGIDEINVGLPRRYVERAIELRDNRELPERAGRGRSRTVTGRRPELWFDPYGPGVHLALPGGSDGAGNTWTVSMGDRTERISVPAGNNTEVEQLLLPVGVAQVDARSDLDDDGSVIQVVDEGDPLLVFDMAGLLVPARAQLPKGPVWAIAPADLELSHSGPVREQHATVARWPGWSASLIDLSEGGSLRLGIGRMRRVEAHGSAHVVGEPAANARVANLPVHADWPTIALPSTASGTTNWTVSVGALGTTAAKATSQHVAGADPISVGLPAGTEELAGRPLRVRARGPLGRSMKADLVVLPGLQIETTPDVRTPVDGGLSPARVRVTIDGHRHEQVLSATEKRLVLPLSTGQRLEVEPPNVALRHLRSGRAGTWRHTAMSITLESILEDPGALSIRLPGATSATLELLDAGGRVVQHSGHDQHSRREGSRVFDLARFTDTLGGVGVGVFRFRSDVFSGRVMSIRPGRLVGDLRARPDRALIEAAAVAPGGVQLALYPRLAPGLEPTVVSLDPTEPTVALPDHLVGAGPLRALARIDDRWAPEPWPRFPAPGDNTHELDFPASSAATHRLHPLAAWIAGYEELPDLADHIVEALAVYEHAPSLDVDRPSADIRRTVGPALAAQPDDLLAGLLRTDVDATAMARALVETGAVATLSRSLSLEDAERLWAKWPGAGLLALTAPLGRGGSSRDQAIEFLRERCGPSVDTLLSGTSCKTLALPRFDGPDLRAIPQAVLEQIRRESGLTPKVLLDQDDRASDGFALAMAFHATDVEDRLERAMFHGHHSVDWILGNVAHRPELAVLAEGIRQRQQGQNWQELPALSLATATAARMAARSHRPDAIFRHQSRDQMLTIAMIAPRLVAADLVMAELVIQGAAHG